MNRTVSKFLPGPLLIAFVAFVACAAAVTSLGPEKQAPVDQAAPPDTPDMAVSARVVGPGEATGPVDRTPIVPTDPPDAKPARPEQRVWQRGQLRPGFSSPPPASAEVHQLPRSRVPAHVYERLQRRLAKAERDGDSHTGYVLRGADRSAQGARLQRLFGGRRKVEGGHVADVPDAVTRQLDARAARGQRPR